MQQKQLCSFCSNRERDIYIYYKQRVGNPFLPIKGRDMYKHYREQGKTGKTMSVEHSPHPPHGICIDHPSSVCLVGFAFVGPNKGDLSGMSTQLSLTTFFLPLILTGGRRYRYLKYDWTIQWRYNLDIMCTQTSPARRKERYHTTSFHSRFSEFLRCAPKVCWIPPPP